MKTSFVVATIALGIIRSLEAQDYEGAEAVLKKLASVAGLKEEKRTSPVEELRLKMKAFQGESGKLPAEEAARRWLAMFDAFATIPNEMLYSQQIPGEELNISTLIATLPPSSAWDALAIGIEARKDEKTLRAGALRLLAAVLRSDEGARKAALRDLSDQIKKQEKLEEYERTQLEENVAQVKTALDWLAGTEQDKAAAFEKALVEQEKTSTRDQGGFGGSISIPDIARSVGEKKATAWILRVFRVGVDDVGIEGKATQALASKLALEHIAELKKPLWNLVRDTNDLALYEALQKKFPKSGGRSYDRDRAASLYLLGLIVKGRSAEAAKLVKDRTSEAKDSALELSPGMIQEAQVSGLGRQVMEFLSRVLAEDPSLPLWRSYIEIAANENESAAALNLLKATLSKPGLALGVHAQVESLLYVALLAANEVEDGIKLLRDLIKSGPHSAMDDGSKRAEDAKKRWTQVGVDISPEMLKRLQRESYGSQDTGEGEVIRLATQLASLGKLLERPELITEAIAAAKGVFVGMAEDNDSKLSVLNPLVNLLVKNARGPEAEALVVEELARITKPDPEKKRGNRGGLELLTTLVGIYDRAGRSADVLALFDQSSLWGVPDLAALESSSFEGTPLLLIAARALAGEGKKEVASKLVRRAVQDFAGNDSAYALLLKVGTDNLEGYLTELAGRDRFEERPLIWKARLQLDAGRTDEAEKTVRAAIAIDPSDGEQGKGDRMRAYAVLGDILEKKGDLETAKIMRGAVKAIRASEDADDWWSAGLLTRAVQKYEDALNLFADAYCIQSRLALRYSDLGNFNKAEEHYRRAFELMPSSFGRVESHCFGCEHAFSGKRAQNVAEKVFTQLAKNMPDKPQVFYLLGYLRDAQGLHSEAAESYRKAVKLDPDYLNAWKQLANTAEETGMSRPERETIAFELLRLDPAGHKTSPNFNEIVNLRMLWDTILKTEAVLPSTETGPLYALAASKTEIEKRGQDNRWSSWHYQTLMSRRMELRNKLVENALVRSTANLLEILSRSR